MENLSESEIWSIIYKKFGAFSGYVVESTCLTTVIASGLYVVSGGEKVDRKKLVNCICHGSIQSDISKLKLQNGYSDTILKGYNT